MSHTDSIRLARAAALGCALAVTLATVAAAADETDACLAASDKGQKERDDGHLLEARKQLLLCSRDVCPRLVRNDCEKWASEVQERMPTIVFGARDAHGTDLVEVGVEIDGATVTTKLDGRPIPVDPGEHRLRLLHEGDAPVEQKVVTREREKGRTIVVDFGAQPQATPAETPAPAGEEKSGPPVTVWVLGGVGAVALGSFAYFGLTGASDASNLRNTCAPRCSDSSVSNVRQKLLIADISLGAGVISLGVAGVLLLMSGHHAEPPPPHDARLSFDLTPVAAGQVAVVRGSF
jgi:hypothetical protein